MNFQVPSPSVSALLSVLCPGLGQLYNGQVTKAVVMFVLYTLLGFSFPPFTLILSGGVVVWSAIDAYSRAKRMSKEKIVSSTKKLATILLIIFFIVSFSIGVIGFIIAKYHR